MSKKFLKMIIILFIITIILGITYAIIINNRETKELTKYIEKSC